MLNNINIMKTAPLLLLCILWSLVEVHTQIVAYVSFMGINLPNHAYVDLTTVGEDISDPGDTVRCHTDLYGCCNDPHGSRRGELYFPDGTELGNAMSGDDIYKLHDDQSMVICHRNNATSPSGIYHCGILDYGDDDEPLMRESVYVGLYPPSEGTCSLLISQNY